MNILVAYQRQAAWLFRLQGHTHGHKKQGVGFCRDIHGNTSCRGSPAVTEVTGLRLHKHSV